MKKIRIAFILILSIYSDCFGQQSYTYTQPKQLNDGWKTNDLNAMNVDITKINKLSEQLHNSDHKVDSLLLIINGEIILEEYFNGENIDKQHDIRSATKSIRSLILGIAIDKGYISHIDDSIFKYLKDLKPTKNKDERKDHITIKHLLTMSSGWDCNDWDEKSKGQEDKVYKKKDWIQYTLNLPMINDPGSVANYCSMGTVLLAEIISQASGMAIDEFANKYLFSPIGINNISWGHTSKKEIIASGKRLYMTSRDLAKIGQLILNKGVWNEKQIISKKWIDESTTPKTTITDREYGYLWWNIPFKLNEKTFESIVATGNGGQYIMVIPEIDMLAIFTGSAYNSNDQMFPFAIVNNVFVPTFSE